MIKQKIKKITPVYMTYQYIWVNRKSRAIYWLLFKHPVFWLRYFGRCIGLGGTDIKKLSDFKDKHKGRRCFIVATGPSLTMNDLKKLEKEYTFGVNSLCKAFDELGWESTYFVIQDYGVYNVLKPYLMQMRNSTFFYGDQWFKKKDVEDLKCPHYKFPRYYGNHLYNRKNYKTGFSYDITRIVHEGYTVAFVALQIAVYMGFSEIYLLGTDCNYIMPKGERHFRDTGYDSPNYKTIGNEMIFAYSVAKEYMDKVGIKVYNASRGGKLEVFPRRDLDDVL